MRRIAPAIAVAIALAGCMTPEGTEPTGDTTPLPTEAPTEVAIMPTPEPTWTPVPSEPAATPMPTATSAPAPTPVPATPTPAPTPTAAPSGGPGMALPPGFAVYFLDVGKGDAIVVQAKNGETMLIDGGPSRGELAIALDRIGVKRIDVIVATHWHENHVSGLIEAFDRYEVKRFYWNGDRGLSPVFREVLTMADAESRTRVVGRGDTIALDNVVIEVMNPHEPSGDANNSSLVLRASCGAVGVLFTGDLTEKGETELVRSGVLKATQVLLVPDHGIAGVATPDFLAALAAKHAVTSWAANDPRFPDAVTVQRLAAAGIKHFMTDTTTSADFVKMVSNCETYTIE
jgi:beta-lactamase superfamily II metal-dependent hydrolase